MKFHLSQEQIQIQDSVRRTLQQVCPPARRRDVMERDGFDPETWRALMDLGLGGLMLPEALGGSGLGLVETALALEIVGRHAAPGPFLGHLLASLAVAAADVAPLKDVWLQRLASGEALAAFAPGEGWLPDASPITQEGGRLSGSAPYVLGAAQATLYAVVVSGGQLAIVEASDAVTTEPLSGSDRTRPLFQVRFDQAPVIAVVEAKAAARIFDAGLVLVAADALGGAEQCLDMAVDYAKTREQFGVAIGQFQALKHQLANMAVEVEPSRALVWYGAYAWDAGLPDAAHAAAQAKAHLADRFVSVSRMAVQTHGGIGYTWEYDLQLWFRRALFDRAYLGSPSVHRARAALLNGW